MRIRSGGGRPLLVVWAVVLVVVSEMGVKRFEASLACCAPRGVSGGSGSE